MPLPQALLAFTVCWRASKLWHGTWIFAPFHERRHMQLTVLRAALVNLCFSADGLSQVGSTGRGITAAAAMHEVRCCRGVL
jgi:hypothetical protein